jgi:hypothetical protein
LALSGSTHSLEGFANTLPAEDDVSLLPLPLATGVVEAVEVVLGLWTIGGRAGMAILPFVCPLGGIVVRALMDDEDAADVEGRAARLEFIEAFSGRGSATDMPPR